MGRAKKKRDAKRRKNMHTRNSIRIKMGKPIFFTLTHCSKKLKGISNRFNYKANIDGDTYAQKMMELVTSAQNDND